MLWEVEIRPLGRDGDRERVCDEFDLLTHAQRGGDLVAASARGYLLEGDLGDADLQRLTTEVLADPLVETATAAPIAAKTGDYLVLLSRRDGSHRADRSRYRAAAHASGHGRPDLSALTAYRASSLDASLRKVSRMKPQQVVVGS